MCPDFFPGCYSGGRHCSHNASILTCVCVCVCVYYAAVQNLVHGCGNVPQTIAESSDTLPIHCAQQVEQSVDMSNQLLAGFNAIPFKWLKLFIRSTYSSAGYGCTLEWMLQTLFTSQSTIVTACRVKTEGAKRGLLSAMWSSMTVTNKSLQPLSMEILYPGANEHSPWGCCIFSDSVDCTVDCFALASCLLDLTIKRNAYRILRSTCLKSIVTC